MTAKVHGYKRIPVRDVVPSEENPRTHSQAQLEQLARSIREFGFTNPILVDEANRLIAGHGRLQAAIAEGLSEVPAIEVAGLSEPQKRALLVADNQLALNAAWDPELLQFNMAALKDEGFDLAVVGFTDEQLAGILADITTGQTDPDDAPAVPAVPVSRLGDVWLLGKHRLRCGDATKGTEVKALLRGVEPGLMVTDPPYGVDYDPEWRAAAGVNKNRAKMGKVLNDDRADWSAAWRLFPGDVVYVWHGGLHSVEVMKSLEGVGFIARAQIIWVKTRMALGRGNYHWQHEPALYAVRKGAKDDTWQSHGIADRFEEEHVTGAYAVRKGKRSDWVGGRKQTTVWFIEPREGKGLGHSTQKPVEAMRRPIENNSLRGQSVYEPFCGTGTTIIAGQMTGRIVYAMEVSPGYIDVAVERWQNFTGKDATLEGTQQTFNQLKDNPNGRPRSSPNSKNAGSSGSVRGNRRAPSRHSKTAKAKHAHAPQALLGGTGRRKGKGKRTGR